MGGGLVIRFDVVTLFPEMFAPILGTSIPKRAAEKGLVSYHLTNIRDFATDAHKSVDDKPFGGGPGMVMMPDPLGRALAAARQRQVAAVPVNNFAQLAPFVGIQEILQHIPLVRRKRTPGLDDDG